MIDLYEQALTIARIIGKNHGYAIALHGSAMRDLDLIAVPWTDTKFSREDFVTVLVHALELEFGTQRGCTVGVLGEPEDKPHGRKTWTILLTQHLWIDLSITPTGETPC